MSAEADDRGSRKRALFRADATAAIGGGHVARCLALADCLAAEGWDCRFSTLADSVAVAPSLSRYRCLPPMDGLSGPGERYELTVVDHYGLDASWEAKSRSWSSRLLAFDDAPTRDHACDILVDAALDRRADEYDPYVPPQCQRLLGPSYAPLSAPFVERRGAAWRRAISSKPGDALRVLVNFGMTASFALYEQAIAAIGRLVAAGRRLHVDVVLGAHPPEAMQSLRDTAAKAGITAQVFGAISNMAETMAEADLAVGAGGVSSWERCCLGLPTIVVVTAANQSANAKALERRAAAANLGPVAGISAEMLATAIDRFYDPSYRTTTARNAALLCDGLGARRLVTLIDPSCAKDGASVNLRPACMADSEIILRWQQEPDARRFARNPEPPQASTHARWMRDKLSDPMSNLMVIEHAGAPAGVLRLEAMADGSFEISILIGTAKSGRGIGRAALSTAARIFKGATLRAEVLAGNERSHALFRGCGFVWDGTRYSLGA